MPLLHGSTSVVRELESQLVYITVVDVNIFVGEREK